MYGNFNFNRCYFSFLFVIFGLIFSFNSNAASGVIFNYQSNAFSACQTARADGLLYVEEYLLVNNQSTYQACVQTDCVLNSSFKTYNLGVGRVLKTGGSCSGMNVGIWNYSGNYTNKTGNTSISFVFTNNGEEPNPCLALSGKTFTGFKAPTANGSGNVCYLGCQASVALQAPPLPLFEGLWSDVSCSVDNVVPASDPSNDPCAGKDPQTCSGTQTPTDPSTPPDSAGGGIQCDSPPYCNGDGVQCSLLYQTWLSRCETQNNGLSNDSNFDKINDSINSGTGQIVDKLDDVIDQQQTTNNKLDTLNNSVNGLGDDLNNINNSINNNTNTLNDLGNSLTAGSEEVEGAESGLFGLVRYVNINPDGFDSTGLGFPRVCPVFSDINFSIGPTAMVIPLSTFTYHCTIFEWVGWLVLAFAGYTASRILLQGD